MSDKILVLSALLLTCATLTVVLLVAWRTLGRPRHALVWACAFGIATAQWGINIAYHLGWRNAVVPTIVQLLALGVCVLVAIGFRERAGKPRRPLVWGAAVLAAGIGVAVSALMFDQRPVATVLVNLLRAAALCVAAATLAPTGRASRAAERSAAVVLVLFAAISLLTAGFNLLGAFGSGSTEVIARALLMITLPAALTAVGLVAVLLLASDLAERLQELAARDPLTGVFNRRGFREAALRALATGTRAGRSASVVIADLDRFKAVNDTHGHAAGDAVLVRVATYLEGAIRVGDLFGRLGGEEFAILLEGVGEGAAADVVERIRAGVEELDLGLSEPLRLTISFGIAGSNPTRQSATLDALLDAADRALYASKMAGRNRVTCAGFEERRDDASVRLHEVTAAAK